MWDEYRNNKCFYAVLRDGNYLEEFEEVCFSDLGSPDNEKDGIGDYNEIEVYQYYCKESEPYRDYFMNMIKKIEPSIEYDDDQVKFKTTRNRPKDLLILTLIRTLYENGCGFDNNAFFKRLTTEKCRYRDPLKRIMYFYVEKNDDYKNGNYLGYGHLLHNPGYKLAYKSTKDFQKAVTIKSIHDFFNGGYKD